MKIDTWDGTCSEWPRMAKLGWKGNTFRWKIKRNCLRSAAVQYEMGCTTRQWDSCFDGIQANDKWPLDPKKSRELNKVALLVGILLITSNSNLPFLRLDGISGENPALIESKENLSNLAAERVGMRSAPGQPHCGDSAPNSVSAVFLSFLFKCFLKNLKGHCKTMDLASSESGVQSWFSQWWSWGWSLVIQT